MVAQNEIGKHKTRESETKKKKTTRENEKQNVLKRDRRRIKKRKRKNVQRPDQSPLTKENLISFVTLFFVFAQIDLL